MSIRQTDLFPEIPDGKKYVSDIPELMAEWHPYKNEGLVPEDISFGSGITIWWLCSRGHEWSATGSAMQRRANLCQHCKTK